MMNDNLVKKRDLSYKERSITVLLPALNEQENLEPTVERLQKALNITMDQYEIIIVNDGSTDNTGEVAEQLARSFSNIIVIHNQTCMGLGHVYNQSIQLATKNYFIYIPSDNTWPYRSFVELFGNLGKADIITSFASNPGMRTWSRRLISRGFTKTMNFLFGLQMNYFNGLTIYPIEYLHQDPITTGGFGFQAEALIKALKLGYSFIELGLPIDERRAGRSKAVNIKNISSVMYTIYKLFWCIKIKRTWEKNASLKHKIFSHSKFNVDETGFMGSNQTLPIDDLRGEKCNIVITGASSGIGAELTKALAQDGHRLFVCARRQKNLQNVTVNSTIAEFKTCDISNKIQVESFVSFVTSKVEHIDILINCAGKFGAIGIVEDTDNEQWFDTIKVNLYGTYLMIQKMIPLLKKSKRPQILNFSGGGAFTPFPNFSAYACSKAALIRLTETLAIELGPYGITVNAIAPGIIATSAHEAVLQAGEKLVGSSQYNRTINLMKAGGTSIAKVIDCIRMLLTNKASRLTGKTISANFDPWNTKTFQDNIADITRSDLYTLCRMNIVNLPKGKLRARMTEAWAKHEIKL